MTHQEAIEKAVKLLRLATSSNPNEAALAASKAQEIIDRYKLGALSADFDSDSQAEPNEPIKDFGDDLLDVSTKIATWKSRLILIICELNQCKGYIDRRRSYGSQTQTGFGLIGRPSDVQTVRYLYNWMTREVDRLTHANCVGYGATYANNFRNGIVDTIKLRLREQRKATEEAVKTEAQAQSSMALVRVNNAIERRERQANEVELWVAQNKRLSAGRPTRYYRRDDGARSAGRIAGNQVRIQPTRATIA